ncbi:hypothetical protein IAT40_000542 [Kwoniella sp. CBS 6097]
MGNILFPSSSSSSHSYLPKEMLPCAANLGPTRFVGGLPGYMVLEDVWYKDRVLYFTQDQEQEEEKGGTNTETDQYDVPRQDEIFTSATSVFDPLWRRYDQGLREVGTVRCSSEDRLRSHGENQQEEFTKRDYVDFEGTTFFLNDGWSKKHAWSGYSWYYHFATEVLLGGFSALSSVNDGFPKKSYLDQSNEDLLLGWTHSTPQRSRRQRRTTVNSSEAEIIDGLSRTVLGRAPKRIRGIGRSDDRVSPDRMIIPWDHKWTGRNGMSPVIARAIFGERNVIGPDAWKEITGHDRWIHFERVLITDRKTAERYSPWSHVWKKPAIDVYGLASTLGFFEPVRRRLLQHWGIPTLTRSPTGLVNRYYPSSSSSSSPSSSSSSASTNDSRKRRTGTETRRKESVKIVYVNRQASDRRFSPDIHRQLLADLHGIRGEISEGIRIKVKEAVLEDWGIEDQFAMFADADIILGIHGNGLTHEVLMPPGGIVIEILPPTTFEYDFPPVSKVLGHGHIIWRNDTIFPREMWYPRNKGNGRKIHDGSEIPLHVPSFMEMLKQTVHHLVQIQHGDYGKRGSM